MYIFLSVWNNSRYAEQILMKCNVGRFPAVSGHIPVLVKIGQK
jgi:hypothetical protein